MFERLPLWLRKTLAWSVHLFTATGAVWGFLTLLAIWDSNFKLAIVYIVIAMLVDGFDGMLARWFHVKEYAAGVDGGLMDNIIDYLNYVVVAALLLIRVPGLLPDGFAMAAAISILLTSAYQFSQTDAKTDNDSYFFKGFPSVWNFLVVYLMLLDLNPWVNLALIALCNILIFVPVKYLYPSRNTRLRRLTLGFTYLYAGIGVWALLQYPEVPKWVAPASFVYVAYYAALSFFPKFGAAKPA
ncbi:MAG: Phosphatidylcholine synthase [Anaerolineales bacterium]|nr:Phosphatidylcholine synthase [Anaerolineales bacterium]WKZ48435.1 MAG: CDP-alcohol phosphatidyltransferase family protein [Anaerolineales bacterium]